MGGNFPVSAQYPRGTPGSLYYDRINPILPAPKTEGFTQSTRATPDDALRAIPGND
jgi:hypothetical protein